MTAVTGRGAQAILGTAGRAAARGVASSSLEGNVAAMLALTAAGTEPAGTTVNGTTSTGAGALDQLFASIDALGVTPQTVLNTVTATASGNHATAAVLTAGINRVTVCATNADSVVLPTMVPGQMVVVINSGAATCQVFAAGTATINAVATDTGVALATTKIGIYFAVTAGLIFGGALA